MSQTEIIYYRGVKEKIPSQITPSQKCPSTHSLQTVGPSQFSQFGIKNEQALFYFSNLFK